MEATRAAFVPSAKHKALCEPCAATINGITYQFKQGILDGFIQSVRTIDILWKQNQELCDKNEALQAELFRLKNRRWKALC